MQSTIENKEIQYIPEDQQIEIQVDLKNVTETATSLKVVDQESMDKANNNLTWINSRVKGIEALRLAIVKPFKDHIKKIDDFFFGLSGQFDNPKKLLTDKVLEYRADLAKQARKKHQDAPEKTTHHDLGAVSYVKCSEYVIADEKKIPKEFYCIDQKKIGARVRELTKDLKVGKTYTDLIPGIKIVCTERPSIKGAN